jgi:hypothetical protein
LSAKSVAPPPKSSPQMLALFPVSKSIIPGFIHLTHLQSCNFALSNSLPASKAARPVFWRQPHLYASRSISRQKSQTTENQDIKKNETDTNSPVSQTTIVPR